MNNESDKQPSESYQIGNISNVTDSPIIQGKNTIGNITKSINQLPETQTEKPGIKEALEILKDAINDPNLDENNKNEALEELKILAEAGQKPQEKQQQAKKAIRVLGSIFTEGLPKTATVIEAFNKVLPIIKTWFGLP